MTLRAWSAWMYRVPDKNDTRISDLEALLLVANDEAARLREELEDTKKLLDATLDVRDRQAARIHELCELERFS